MEVVRRMDRIDRAILHLLQLDGRLSNARLAAQVNLSESACLRRVKALEQRGYLRDYVGLVDQAMAGYPDNVFVRITLRSQQQADLAAFEAEVCAAGGDGVLFNERRSRLSVASDCRRRARLRACAQSVSDPITGCCSSAFILCFAHCH